jgi:glycosyltransferase involved in cell wall biosynthesis
VNAKNEVLVSIIIPNRNGGNTIRKTLQKAAASVEKHRFEIIVVDDCSDDNSSEEISAAEKSMRAHISPFANFADFTVKRNKRQRGASFSRNIGIRAAKGKFLIFIDNDVFLEKKTGEKLVSKMENHDISFPKIVFENKRVMYPLINNEECYPMISACFAVKKDSLKNGFAFDEKYETYLEDSDFFIRAGKAGLSAVYAKDALAVHGIPKDKDYDYSRRYFLECRNTVYGMRKHLGSAQGSPFSAASLFRNFVCGIFNFRWFDWSSYDREKGKFRKILMLISPHKRITRRNSLVLISAFFRGIIAGFHLKSD